MMQNTITHSTIGGTIIAVVAIPTTTIVTTIVVAMIGAVTSFFVSLLLKTLWKYFKNKTGI